MFEYTHIPCPPKENYEKLHLDVEAWITPQVHSAYPGITDVIQRLSKTYTLHTASNESSQMLDAYLRGLNDVHECFQILFGPDSY